MDNRNYEKLDFNRLPRIPRRVIWQVGLMIVVRLLWGIIQPQNYFWMVLIIVNILGWMASYGWRMAIQDLRKWIDRITEEV
jgi:hypothetical protein